MSPSNPVNVLKIFCMLRAHPVKKNIMSGAKFSLAQHQYNNTVRGGYKPVTPPKMDGPRPEGAKLNLNQFE